MNKSRAEGRKLKKDFVREAVEALCGPAQDYENVDRDQTMAWLQEHYPDLKVNSNSFYGVRNQLLRERAIARRNQTTHIPPLQLVRTLKQLIEIYGKDEIRGLIDEITQ